MLEKYKTFGSGRRVRVVRPGVHCKLACMGGKDEAVGVDEGNRELTTQLSRFSFHVPAHSCNVLVLVNEG